MPCENKSGSESVACMKKFNIRVFSACIALFLLGLLSGTTRWILFYQEHIAPRVLATLRDKELARVLRVMVEKQSHGIVFAQLQEAFPEEETWMHFNLGHPLGEALYKKYGTKAYALCEQFYNFGCYHGVITYMIRENGQDPEIISKVKKACEEGVLGIVGCVHPLGHALGVVYNTDITRALSLCDVYYPYPDIVPECWIGAIMEHSAEFTQEYWVEHIDSFCDSFESKYEGVCTRIVIRHVAREWNFDFTKLFKKCRTYEMGSVQAACFNEVGYWIGQQHHNDIQRTIQICAEAVGYRDKCLVGVARMFQTTDRKSESRLVCREMADKDTRVDCLKIAN